MNAIDPRPVYARATEQAATLIATVRPEHLTGRTPCTEFDVRTLLSHVVGGTLRIAVVGEGGDGLAVHPFADGVADDGWTAAYDEVRTRVLKAWSGDDRMAAPVRVPWGEVPGHAALSGYVMELVTHTWDLSESLGHPLELDPELADFALTTARRVLPAPDRDERTPFASVRPTPEGADVYGQLAAWLGRELLTRA
ncbi:MULTISPECIES: TIGR03086 family metal-binding protein [unclassified Streptomyces]|uniref:TIGR03086 family metal-binding protein n=1 Tax=unclassified Streptomyces TaxID=2593676 RepID=UPI00224EA82E|nr:MULTISPECIES: TIGR03086 family metal-binding protein [unclassified Streptomyces]MCX5051206.1 TIGR03086 family metal-binding protein [Streptomyces sp. NBC_00474]